MGGHNSPITLNEKPISPLTLDALIGEGLYHTMKFARDSVRHKKKVLLGKGWMAYRTGTPSSCMSLY